MNEPWQRQTISDYSIGLANPLTLLQYMSYYKSGSAQQIGSETRNGVLLHRVRFDVDTDQMAASSDDPALKGIFSSSHVAVDVWVLDGSYLPDTMLVSVDRESGANVTLRVTFSNLDKPVEINPPSGGS